MSIPSRISPQTATTLIFTERNRVALFGHIDRGGRLLGAPLHATAGPLLYQLIPITASMLSSVASSFFLGCATTDEQCVETGDKVGHYFLLDETEDNL